MVHLTHRHPLVLSRRTGEVPNGGRHCYVRVPARMHVSGLVTPWTPVMRQATGV